MTRIAFLLFLSFFIFTAQTRENPEIPVDEIFKHIEALAGEHGIGPRVAGSAEEVKAANYIHQQFDLAGLETEILPFSAVFRDQEEPSDSQNVVATVKGKSTKVFVIGAHYDSVPASTGSRGVIDNAASIAVMLELAKSIQQGPTPNVSFTFVAFGAEENGLNGAWDYVNKLSSSERDNIIGMLNMDSIAGGDNLYIHSALSKGYSCKGDVSNFKSSPIFRDQLLALAKSNNLPFNKHPGNPNFPPGETGGWSDHAPFACAGIPIANLEATNFSVQGKRGKDGYSQTENPNLWSCYDKENKGTCDKENEKQWGEIWHTQFDRIDVLQKEFPNRLNTQLSNNYQLLKRFVYELD